MQVEEESPKQYVDIARAPDKEMRPQRPVPLGLRPGRSSASLPGLTISTYGLRRAPRIRSVLATTHHAPSYETGSSYGCVFTVLPFQPAPASARRRDRRGFPVS